MWKKVFFYAIIIKILHFQEDIIMSLKSSTKLDNNRYELEVEVSAEDFAKAINDVYLKKGKKVSVPGFRKGKAPRAFVEKYYGEGVFYEDAMNSVYPKAFEQAVSESELEVVDDKPELDIVSVGKEGLLFKAIVTVKPEVEIDGYMDISVTPDPVEVLEKDIDDAIEEVRQRGARMVSVDDRVAQMGDVAVIDFKGFVDGVAFPGGEGKNHSLKLGSGHFIPGFEEQVAGRGTGEKFNVNVKFPDDYNEQSLKGKDAIFEVEIHEIKAVSVPVVDDEFVKDVSEFDTLAEYREDLSKKILEAKRRESRDKCENKIVEQVIGLLKADIPEIMLENKVNEDLREFAYRLNSQGADISTYLKHTGITMDQLRLEVKPHAESQVKLRLALEKIAEKEGFTATNDEVESKLLGLSEQYKMDLEKVKEIISKRDMMVDIRVEKAINFLKENCIV